MEINFKSEFFKKIFYSESLNDKNLLVIECEGSLYKLAIKSI